MANDTAGAPAPAPAFDFAAFDAHTASHEKGKEFEIKTPDGKSTGVFFTVCGYDSARYRRAQYDVQRRRMADVKPSDDTFDKAEESSAELMAACVLSWRTQVGDVSQPYVVNAGKQLPLTFENAVTVMRGPLVRGQTSLAIHNGKGFTTT